MNPNAPHRARVLGFPKSFRIRKRPDFLWVQRRGKRQVSDDLVAVYSKRRSSDIPGSARVGFTVSKKVGNAVARNRVKRRLREAVRHSLHLVDAVSRPVDIVFIARSSAADASSETLRRQVVQAFDTIADWTSRPTERRSGTRR